MIRRALAALLALAFAMPAAGQWFYSTPGLFVNTSGNQTNVGELARFVSNVASEPYASSASSLSSHATTAKDSWPYDIQSGDWEDDGANCEPVGDAPSATFNIRNAATDVFAMALHGYIDGDNALFYAAVKTRLLEFAATTDFDSLDLSGGNQCILDLGTAVYHVIESAFLLENADYALWTEANRTTLSTWLAEEVFPLVSWGIETRKNNWGIVTFGGALAIATYTDGGVALLTKHDASTVSPAGYIAAAGTPLGNWLSNSSSALDSDCFADVPARVYGLQSTGGFPDELRRELPVDLATNCGQTSIDFACVSSTDCNGTDEAHFYQQKSTNGLARVCEILRRRNGPTCFELTSHGGNDQALFDAIQFSTGGEDDLDDFTDFFIQDTTQGFRYVAGQYYQDWDLINALDSSPPDVSVRGGRDFAYTKITHEQRVAYASPIADPGAASIALTGCELFQGGTGGTSLIYATTATLGLVPGDLAVIFFAVDAGGTEPTLHAETYLSPTGHSSGTWTELRNVDGQTNGAGYPGVAAWYHEVPVGESANPAYTVAWTTSGGPAGAVCKITGFDTLSPQSDTIATQFGTSSTPTAPAVTATGDRLALYLLAMDGGAPEEEFICPPALGANCVEISVGPSSGSISIAVGWETNSSSTSGPHSWDYENAGVPNSDQWEAISVLFDAAP